MATSSSMVSALARAQVLLTEIVAREVPSPATPERLAAREARILKAAKQAKPDSKEESCAVTAGRVPYQVSMAQRRNQGRVGADDLRKLARPTHSQRQYPSVIAKTLSQGVINADDLGKIAKPLKLPKPPRTASLGAPTQFNPQHAAEVTKSNRNAVFIMPSEIVTRIRLNLEAGWTCTLSSDLREDGPLAIHFTNLATKEVTSADPRGTPSTNPPSYESTLASEYCHLRRKAGGFADLPAHTKASSSTASRS